MAGGMSVFKAGDKGFEDVFKRADKDMYENKMRFKKEFGAKPR